MRLPASRTALDDHVGALVADLEVLGVDVPRQRLTEDRTAYAGRLAELWRTSVTRQLRAAVDDAVDQALEIERALDHALADDAT